MNYREVCSAAREQFYGLISAMNLGETSSVMSHASKLRSHLMQMAREGSEEQARKIEGFARAVAEYRKTGGTSPLPNFPD